MKILLVHNPKSININFEEYCRITKQLNVKLLDFLIENSKEKINLENTLYVHCKFGTKDPTVVQYLVSKGANPNNINKENNILSLVCEKKDKTLLKLLLYGGADANIRAKNIFRFIFYFLCINSKFIFPVSSNLSFSCESSKNLRK